MVLHLDLKYGMVWYGMVRYVMAWYGIVCIYSANSDRGVIGNRVTT